MAEKSTRRRAILRRWLHENGACYTEAAHQCGYDPSYLRKLMTGEKKITDSAAWRLQYRLGIPMHEAE